MCYTFGMQKQTLNYRIFIDKEKSSGRKKAFIYNAYCPALGISDFGKSIDDAIKHITDLMVFHVESLASLGHVIPTEEEATTLVTSITIPRASLRKTVTA